MGYSQLIVLIATLIIGGISLKTVSPSIIESIKVEKVNSQIINTEKAIYEAVCRHTNIKGVKPVNMADLIANGFFQSTSNDNGFGGTFDFTIDSSKGTLIISTDIADTVARTNYINNYRNTYKPVQSTGNTVLTTFVLPMSVMHGNGQFMTGIPVQTTAPSLLTNKFWYDTSSGVAVLKMNDGISWKEVQSTITSSGGGGGGTSTSTSVSIVDSVAALPTTGVNGDIKYVYDGTSNTVIQYAYYNGSWVVAGGGTSTAWSYTIQDIYTNGYNNLTVLASGVLYTTSGNAGSWGDWNSGRFAGGAQTQFGLENLKPVTIPSTSPIIKVSVSGENSYALLQNGELYAWGYNGYGQLGLGHNSNITVPTLTATGVVDIYRDETHGGYSISADVVFIKKSDGYVYATGYNGYGVFGNGTTATSYSWVKLTNWGTNVKNVWSIGANYQFVIVEKTDGTIWFAGKNNYGQSGLGHASHLYTLTEITSKWSPGAGYTLKEVRGEAGTYDGTVYDYNSLYMVFDDGVNSVLKTCGNNSWGQLGNGTSNATYTPYTINLGGGLIKQFSVAGGTVATVRALKTDGTLYAWGYNYFGQVGNGTTSNVLTPTIVATGVMELFGDKWDANTHSYYLSQFIKKDDGNIYGTGFSGHGQMGDGYQNNHSIYQRVLLPNNTNIVKMARYDTTGSGSVIVAVSDKNELFAWGYNNQFGVSNTTGNNVLTPMKFTIQKP